MVAKDMDFRITDGCVTELTVDGVDVLALLSPKSVQVGSSVTSGGEVNSVELRFDLWARPRRAAAPEAQEAGPEAPDRAPGRPRPMPITDTARAAGAPSAREAGE